MNDKIGGVGVFFCMLVQSLHCQVKGLLHVFILVIVLTVSKLHTVVYYTQQIFCMSNFLYLKMACTRAANVRISRLEADLLVYTLCLNVFVYIPFWFLHLLFHRRSQIASLIVQMVDCSVKIYLPHLIFYFFFFSFFLYW